MAEDGVRPVVTISSSYGAGGSVVGPRVAQLIGVPFLDRAIPAAVAEKLQVSFESAVAHESPQTRLGRFIASFARLPDVMGSTSSLPTETDDLEDEEAYRRQTEHVIWEAAASGGVILGRAGALILRNEPGVLRVRLDGPREARIAQVARLQGLDEADVARRQRFVDRARDAYAKRLYGVERLEPGLFHLILDGTALPFDTCATMIADASAILAERAST